MPNTFSQTQQFLPLLQFSDKLTSLYVIIRKLQEENSELLTKIQYMQFKNKALEKSLFQHQSRNKQKQSIKNSILVRELIGLEQQINIEIKDIQTSKDTTHNNNNTCGNPKYKYRNSKQKQKQTQQYINRNKLVTIKQQPQMQSTMTTNTGYDNNSTRSTYNHKQQKSKHTNPNSVLNLSLTNNQNNANVAIIPKPFKNDSINNKSSINGRSRQKSMKSGSQSCNTTLNGNNKQNNQHMGDKVSQLQKQLQKYEKNKKMAQVQLKRLRKMNEQYANKCKRLQKLVQARQQLYSNMANAQNHYIMNENMNDQPYACDFINNLNQLDIDNGLQDDSLFS